MKKSFSYFIVIIFTFTFLVVITQYSFAYPLEYFERYYNKPPKQTEVIIYLDKHSKFITSTFYKEKNWIPLRDIFKPYAESIYWDDKKKVAYVRNQGKELIINFSSKKISLNKNQFLVPSKYSKFINGKTYVDGFWIGWIFDMYASDDNPEREKWKSDLSFLGIQDIDFLYESIPKDQSLHLAIYFKKKLK